MHAQTDDAQLKNIMPPAPSLGWTGIKIPADTRQPGLYYFRFWQLSGQHNHLRVAVKSRFKNLQNHERLLKKKLKKNHNKIMAFNIELFSASEVTFWLYHECTSVKVV